VSVELIREYWTYHHWANRRLFDVVAALGDDAAGREVGTQFSESNPRAMLVHVYGADRFWLETWRGRPPAIVRGDPTDGLVIRTLGELRNKWDELENEQRRFLADLGEADLWRPLDGKTPGRPDFQPAAGHAAAPRSDPRGPSPERARHDAHDDERLASGHRDQLVLPREVRKGGAQVSGELVTIPARGGKAAQASAGQHIKVVNTHGTQVVDAWAFNARDLTEWMSMEASRASFMKLAAAVGDTFVTNQRRPILTLVEDTSNCVHDTLMAPCDRWRYGLLGVAGYHDNCRDNLHSALANLGVVIRATPPSLNLFMNIPWTAAGQLAWGEPVSPPGGYAVFRAEMDLVVALSACPQDILPINGRTGRTTEAHFAIQ